MLKMLEYMWDISWNWVNSLGYYSTFDQINSQQINKVLTRSSDLNLSMISNILNYWFVFKQIWSIMQ